MSCGGGHLGFPTGIKRTFHRKVVSEKKHFETFVEDHSMNNVQFGIIFVVSEKKAFEHFPIGSNVNLCPAVVAILDFRSA